MATTRPRDLICLSPFLSLACPGHEPKFRSQRMNDWAPNASPSPTGPGPVVNPFHCVTKQIAFGSLGRMPHAPGVPFIDQPN